jgi:hypothetical protein
MNATHVVDVATQFHAAGIPPVLTQQIASVVHGAGLAQVNELGSDIATDPTAGAVIHEYVDGAMQGGRASNEVAEELIVIAQMQALLLTSMDDLISGSADPE